MSDGFWRVFVTSGLFAAAVGAVVGFAVTKWYPSTTAAETKKAGDDARAIIDSHNFDQWPLAIRCYDSRGAGIEKIYHLNVVNFPSERVRDPDSRQPMKVVGYRHLWFNASEENSRDRDATQRTHDVEFNPKTKRIVWANTKVGETLRNCHENLTLGQAVALYQEVDR